MIDAEARAPRRARERLLAVGFLLPSLLHLVGRRGEGTLLVALGLLAPWIVWWCSAGLERGPRAGRVLAATLACAFATPVVPTLFGVFGFSYERVFFGGALACLAWHGAFAARGSPSRFPGTLRALLLASAAWSLGTAAHALWVSFPADAPWLAESVRAALQDLLGFRSLVEPTHAIPRLSLHLEALALTWAALEVGLADAKLVGRAARGFALALPAGVLVGLAAALFGFEGVDPPLAVRLDSAAARVFRPLPDHNSLGSALVLMLPPAGVVAWRAFRCGSRVARALFATALACGLLLLLGSSSKSAFAGLAFGVLVGCALWIACAARRMRRRALFGGGALLLAIASVQLLPQRTADELMQVRYVRDVVKAARFDFAASYLREMRYPVWRAGWEIARSAPLAGAGLGRFPLLLGRHVDPRDEGAFEPLHENAHNQYLQWLAEEGVVGAGLGLAVLLVGLGAAAASARRPRGGEPSMSETRLLGCALAAGLAGMLLNLVVGHPLLVPAVAGLCASAVGIAVSLAGRSESAPPAAQLRPRRRRTPWLALALAFLGAAPALFEERAPLEEHRLDCYPWLRTATPAGAEVSRMLGPDARWMQRWGNGSRMFVPAKSIVPPDLVGGGQVLDVRLDGELVLTGLTLPRKRPEESVNPPIVLKLDRPQGVEPGDLVEIEITCRPPYAESLAGGMGQSIWGPRTWKPTFGEPR